MTLFRVGNWGLVVHYHIGDLMVLVRANEWVHNGKPYNHK